MTRPSLPTFPVGDIADLLDILLDAAEWHHFDATSDESFTECRCCGEWEGHTDACPIPGVRAFLERVYGLPLVPRRLVPPVLEVDPHEAF